MKLANGLLWKCAVCQSISEWTDEHQWYGSLLDIDGGGPTRIGGPRKAARPIVVTCSDLCRDRAMQIGIVPADAGLIA